MPMIDERQGGSEAAADETRTVMIRSTFCLAFGVVLPTLTTDDSDDPLSMYD
jgi:hypothetical protein